MKTGSHRAARAVMIAALGIWLTFSPTVRLWAAEITLKDGRVLEGRVGHVSKLVSDPLKPSGADGEAGGDMIYLIDDDLRRTFVSYNNVVDAKEPAVAGPGRNAAIKIEQHVARAGARVAAVGQFIKVTPWDKFGRRTVTMSAATPKGFITVIQGITEITPLWTKVEGLQTVGNPFLWDMRIATSSIPRNELRDILENQQKLSGAKDPEDYRAKVVRLYMWGGRYFDAEQELKELLAAAKNPDDYKDFAKQLKAMSTNLLLQEIEQRAKAGQHQFAFSMLTKFATQPQDPKQPVPGEVLQRVGQMLKEYETEKTRGTSIVEQLDVQLKLVKEDAFRYRFEPAVKQIKDELNYNTLDRLAAFFRLRDAENLKPEQKLALAISGWVLGADAANEDPTIAMSALTIRELMRKYLREPSPLKRADLAQQLNSQAGFTAKLTAQIADFMKPPLDLPEKLGAPGNIKGFYELSIPGGEGEAPVTYFVQLPPEYDPYRRYPTVVTLHGSGTTPEQQIEWWSGPGPEKKKPEGKPTEAKTPAAKPPEPQSDEPFQRQGQATRQGYIVIAPAWTKAGQTSYDGSAAEHYAVLGCLRDACRRFSIDTDRVYLSGHSLGGTAAWDIGVAHPDLWAGVIPIVGVQDERSFVAKYPLNAKYVPLYAVFGELDGDKLARSSINFDRYMIGSKYDTTVVEYRGRGHEDFSDEIQRLFDWMGRKKRDFFPKNFEVNTMRTWDNYFWWLEINEFPAGVPCLPVNGDAPKDGKPMFVSSMATIVNDKTGTSSTVTVNAGHSKCSVWLSPELVDMTHPIFVKMNGHDLRAPQPRGETVLEDIRTRGDRRHPFWIKVE